jgi:ketosteroid isomerase-like protein
MIATSPEHAVELLDRAFAQGDLHAVLSFYEDAAVVITEPGKAARGTEELRSSFARAMQSGASAKQLKTQVIEADGVALFLSRWTLHVKARYGEDFHRNHSISQAAGRRMEGSDRQSFGSVDLGT